MGQVEEVPVFNYDSVQTSIVNAWIFHKYKPAAAGEV